MSMNITISDVYMLCGTEEPERNNYWCSSHDRWGKEGECCPICQRELVDRASLGIYSPHDEWEAAQKAMQMIIYRNKAYEIEKELREYYGLEI